MTKEKRKWREYESPEPDPTLPNPMLSVLEAIEKNHPELLQKTTDDLADIIEQCDCNCGLDKGDCLCDNEPVIAPIAPFVGAYEDIRTLSVDLLSKALRAICFMRDYCPSDMPAIKGLEWFDVGSEIAGAIPHDKWAIEFRNRVAIDQQHRDIASRLRDRLAMKYAECVTPMVDVVPGFLDMMGFSDYEQRRLKELNIVRVTDKVLDDDDQAKAFDEHEVG